MSLYEVQFVQKYEAQIMQKTGGKSRPHSVCQTKNISHDDPPVLKYLI